MTRSEQSRNILSMCLNITLALACAITSLCLAVITTVSFYNQKTYSSGELIEIQTTLNRMEKKAERILGNAK